MNDVELAALTALFNQQAMEMHDVNQDRIRNDYALAYDGSVEWPERDALEDELRRRGVIATTGGK